MTPTPKRPRVICHMLASVDGRIVVEGWPLSAEGRRQYELVHSKFKPDGWLCGRVTMEHFAAGTRSDAEVARAYDGPPREDFVAPGVHPSLRSGQAPSLRSGQAPSLRSGQAPSVRSGRAFAIVVDPRGKLVWESGEIDGDHVVAILTERVSDDYLTALRECGVSFLLAGRDDVDLPLALEKIGARLGVRTLMLEGGGGINGSMLRAGLIDEVSLLLAPVADGRIGMATLFDPSPRSGQAHEEVTPRRLALESVERRADDVLWLRYQVEEA